MTRIKIRIRKDCSPSKAQIYFSREQAAKRDESSFLLDWVAGCESPLVGSLRMSAIYGTGPKGGLERRRWVRE